MPNLGLEAEDGCRESEAFGAGDVTPPTYGLTTVVCAGLGSTVATSGATDGVEMLTGLPAAGAKTGAAEGADTFTAPSVDGGNTRAGCAVEYIGARTGPSCPLYAERIIVCVTGVAIL